MSIFPKRSVRGSTVTIHWNFNTAHLSEVHVFPWVRIGVKDPLGRVTMLFEDHVLGLPDPPVEETGLPLPKLKYLNKNLPLMILADYLGGSDRKEKLVEILQNIQSGRHYYFSYTVPDDAPLGKYTLVSEVHSGGEVRHSKTANDDFFLVEKVELKTLKQHDDLLQAVVFNHSPEKTPVKLVGCQPMADQRLRTEVEVFELLPEQETLIDLSAPLNYLLYNEEREIIPLRAESTNYLLRNQQVLTMTNAGGNTYLVRKDREEAYSLTDESRVLWQKADGLLSVDELTNDERKILEEMMEEKLIGKITM